MESIKEYKDITSIKNTLTKDIYIRYLERIIKILIKRHYLIMALDGQKRLNSQELKKRFTLKK